MEPPGTLAMKALTDFCRNEQALKQFKHTVKKQREPLVAQRQLALKYLYKKLKTAPLPCFRIDDMYARLKLTNRTVPFNETIVNDAIQNVTLQQLSGAGNENLSAIELLGKLKFAILANMKNARTTRTYTVDISVSLPREFKAQSGQIPLAEGSVLTQARSLIETRRALQDLQGTCKQYLASNVEKQSLTIGPVFEFMSSNQSVSQRINLTNTASGAVEVYYVRRKITHHKPALTVSHMKTVLDTSLAAIWNPSVLGIESRLTMDAVLSKLSSIAKEVLARLDDGRTEVVKEHLSLDKGRRIGRGLHASSVN